MRTLGDITLEEWTRIGNEERVTNDNSLKRMWEDRPKGLPYSEESLRETFQFFKHRLNTDEISEESKGLTDEEIASIKAGGIARFEALAAWQNEHKEEADAIIKNACGVLALITSTLECASPALAQCKTDLVVGAFQSAYLAGYLRGSGNLNLDNITK